MKVQLKVPVRSGTRTNNLARVRRNLKAILRSFQFSLRAASFSGNPTLAVAGGRAYIRLNSFRIEENGGRLNVILGVYETRIEPMEVPVDFEARSLANLLTREIHREYPRRVSSGRAEMSFEAGRNGSLSSGTIDGIKIDIRSRFAL